MIRPYRLAASCLLLVSAFHISASAVEVPPVNERTVWKLQELANQGRTDILEELFVNHSMRMGSVPTGYSAGAGARALGITGPLATVAGYMVDGNWRGKVFFPTANPYRTEGLNRIKKSLLIPFAGIGAMAYFIADLVDQNQLGNNSPLVYTNTGANYVTLNYASPTYQPNWPEKGLATGQPATIQEIALMSIQVYDIMVAVPGKYGPLYVGKTWQGQYGGDGQFTATSPNLLAWYFLDYNPQALEVQRTQHWKSGKWDATNQIPQSRF